VQISGGIARERDASLNQGRSVSSTPLGLDARVSVSSDRPALETPSLSLIVPTHNRRELLARLLSGLERQHTRGTRFEVVVAVDGSTDGTDEMLARLHTSYPLRVVSKAHGGAGAARNAAIAAATGDVLLFVDDDVLPQDGLLEGHLRVHSRDPLAAVAGRMAPPPDHALPVWLAWEAAVIERHYSRIEAGLVAPSWREFWTSNASVRREHALAVGGFDKGFKREEDVDFGYRLSTLGLRFYFLPDAVIHHIPDKTLDFWLHQLHERGHDQLLHRDVRVASEFSFAEDWRGRHPLNRMLTRWCLGHTARTRLVVGALKRAIASPRPGARRLQLLLCSALVNINYWSGVAELIGGGDALWRHIEEPAVAVIADRA